MSYVQDFKAKITKVGELAKLQVLGIKKSKKFAKNLVNNALQALDYFDNKSDPLRAIAHYIIDRKK